MQQINADIIVLISHETKLNNQPIFLVTGDEKEKYLFLSKLLKLTVIAQNVLAMCSFGYLNTNERMIYTKSIVIGSVMLLAVDIEQS